MKTVKESLDYLFNEKNIDRNKRIGIFFSIYCDNFEAEFPLLYFLDTCVMKHGTPQKVVVPDEVCEMLKEGKAYLRGTKAYLAFFELLIGINTNDFSNFSILFNQLIDEYFLGKDDNLDQLSDIELLINLLIVNYEQEARTFVRKIFKDLIQYNSDVQNVCLMNSIIKTYGVANIKIYKNIQDVFNHLINPEVIAFSDFNQYLELSDYCMQYNQFCNQSKRKYIDVVLSVFNDINDYYFQPILQKCRDYIKKEKYKLEELPNIESKIESFGKKALDSMQAIDIPVPEELTIKLNEYSKKREEFLRAKTNVDKMYWYLLEFNVFTKEQLIDFEKRINEGSVFLNFVNTMYYDNNGEVINYKDLSQEDNDCLMAKSGFNYYSSVVHATLIKPFFNVFECDENVEREIKKFCNNNSMLDYNGGWSSKMADCMIRYFKKDTNNLINVLAPLFEHSLRYYFKNENLYIKKFDSNEYITLGDIFNHNKGKNEFRDKLLETIDEDFYWLLCFLLTDRLGFNGRNSELHGLNDPNFGGSLPVFYACTLIFKLLIGYSK